LTNSNKHENLQLRARYRRENPLCELANAGIFRSAFGSIVLPDGEIVAKNSPGSEVHHIASCVTGTPRWDLTENLIHLCRPIHAFCERYAKDGLAICSLLKANKDPCEFDPGLFSRITHTAFIGYFECMSCKTQVGRACQSAVLEWLSKAAA
jgi:hypothetical protein